MPWRFSIINNDQITMDIKIDIKGNYAEYINKAALEDITIDFLKRLEEEFEKEIKRLCLATIYKFQKEYKADVFHFCQYIKAEKPAFWDKNESKQALKPACFYCSFCSGCMFSAGSSIVIPGPAGEHSDFLKIC